MREKLSRKTYLMYTASCACLLVAALAGTSRGACYVYETWKCCNLHGVPFGQLCIGDPNWICETQILLNEEVNAYNLKNEEGIQNLPQDFDVKLCRWKVVYCGLAQGSCTWDSQPSEIECHDYEEETELDCDPVNP